MCHWDGCVVCHRDGCAVGQALAAQATRDRDAAAVDAAAAAAERTRVQRARKCCRAAGLQGIWCG